MTVKIGLKQENDEEGIIVETMSYSTVTGLVISLKFVRKNMFKMKKLERLIYMRNVNSIINHEEPIDYVVEVKLFYREYKERTEIYVIRR